MCLRQTQNLIISCRAAQRAEYKYGRQICTSLGNSFFLLAFCLWFHGKVQYHRWGLSRYSYSTSSGCLLLGGRCPRFLPFCWLLRWRESYCDRRQIFNQMNSCNRSLAWWLGKKSSLVFPSKKITSRVLSLENCQWLLVLLSKLENQYIQKSVRYVEEGSIFWTKSPFVEVREIAINSQGGKVDIQLSHSMSCIDEKGNFFFLEKCR